MKTYFPPIWTMSGTLNFFGEGFSFHKIYKKLFGKRFTFDGVLLVAKTTTVSPNKGNMPMQANGVTPQEFRPACITVGPWQFLLGVMLNAVGLSGPGISDLLKRNIWQQRTKSFMISFMSIARSDNEEAGIKMRLREFENFVSILSTYRDRFLEFFIIQINLSCPNVTAGKKSDDLIIKEALGYMDLMKCHLPGVECIFKVSVLMHPKTAVAISQHPQCAGICVTNAIPWSSLTQFQQEFYYPLCIFTGQSPLARFGGGALSGKPLLPLVEKWVQEARQAGFEKHINAGGGILCANDVNRLKVAGADSVSIGSVVLLRPWRLKSIIYRAHYIFPYGQSNRYAF